jgi:hypothetical protein
MLQKTIKNDFKNNYCCIPCNYTTHLSSNFIRHKKTKKHINKEMLHNATNINQNVDTIIKKYKCSCGNEYLHHSSYYRHTKNCKNNKIEENSESNQLVNKNNVNAEEINYKELILQVLNQNKELQDLLIKQQEDFINYQKQQQEENEKKYENLVLHIQPKNNTVIKNSNNKTVNNNTQYNIMMFFKR